MNYQIEEWLIEPKHLRISREGEQRRMEPRVMAVLVALIEAAPEPLSRETLEATVWGDVHVSETLVRRAISTLRNALDDSARKPRYIETIPRAGYALKAVAIALDEQALQARTNPVFHRLVADDTKNRLSIHQRKRILSIGAAVLCCLALGWLFLQKNQTAPQSELDLPPRGISLSPAHSQATQPAMKQDGSETVFVGETDTGQELFRYVKVEGRPPKAMQMTHTGGGKTSPAFSPNGKYLAYGHTTGDITWRVMVMRWGEEARIIARGSGALTDITWRDNNTLLCSIAQREDNRLGPARICRLTLDPADKAGGDAEFLPITKPMSTHRGDFQPAVNSSGQLAFIREYSPGFGDIFLLDGGLPERKLTNTGRFGGLAWGPKDMLYFSVYEGGRFVLKQVSPINNAQRLHFGRSVRRFAILGGHILFEDYRRETEILRGPLQRNHKPAAHISNGSWDSMPVYSWSGDWIAFVSERGGNRDIWVVDHDGANLRQLTSWGGAMLMSPAWSRDDQRLAFEVHQDGGSQIYEIGLESGLPVQMTDGAADRMPCYGPQNQWLYYARQLGKTASEVRRMRTDRSQDQAVTTPQQRADRVAVTATGAFATTSSADALFAIEDDGALKQLFANANLDTTNWTPAGSHIYYLTRSESEPQLVQYNPITHKHTAVRNLGAGALPHSLSVSVAEDYYLFARETGFKSTIRIMPLSR